MQAIDRLIQEGLPTHRFESTVSTLKGKTLTVSVVMTRMRHGSSVVLHVSMVDVTDLKRLIEVRGFLVELAG